MMWMMPLLIKITIFESLQKIGNVFDWSDDRRLIDENNEWKTVKC
jgi:hypothetical protein